MEPARSYDRQEAFDILKNTAYRGSKVNRLIKGYQSNPHCLSMEGNKIKLAIPGKNEIIVDLAVQEKNKKLSIYRFFKYTIRSKGYKQDYDVKINKILDQVYKNSSVSLPKNLPMIHQDAQKNYNSGMKLIKGDFVAHSNFKEAIKFFKLAAKEDHPNSLYMLGKLYMDGKGVKHDVKKAMDYYERASELGLGKASLALAVIYLNEGPKDKGQDYLKLAEQQGEDIKNFSF